MVSHSPRKPLNPLWPLLAGVSVLTAALLVGGVFLILHLRGTVQVQNVAFSPDKAVYGGRLTATVTLENTGVWAGDYHAVLNVDGAQSAAQDLSFEGREVKDVSFDLSGCKPGEHKLSIGKAEQPFRVLRPAAFKVLEVTAQPDSLMVGEGVTITARVTNTGEVAGDYAANFLIDGRPLDTKQVSVQPGAEQTVELKFTTTAADFGPHDVSLDGVKASFTALRPAAFAVETITLSKATAKPNEKITVSGSVANVGDVPGKYSLKLVVNGKAEQTKEFSLNGQESAGFSFTVAKGSVGSYKLQLGSATATLKVVNISRPANGALLVKTNSSGSGRLNVTNNYSDRDVIVSFASASNPKKTVLSVYVRAGSKASNVKVKDGSYIIFYSYGNDYDTGSKRFTANATYGKFDETASFKTTRSGSYIYYSVQNLTFNSSSGGSPTTSLDPADFPG